MCSGAQEEGALRNCLGDINAAAERLGRLVSDPQAQECLGMLNRGVLRMLRLLQHRELIRRLTEGEALQPEGVVELGELCRRVCAESEGLLSHADIRLRVHTPEEEILVAGDEELLEYLLLLLLSNGAKASGEGGGVSLSLRVEGKTARIAILDGGRGPDCRALDLQRGEEHLLPDLRPQAGAGRGLALARRIAAFHGGGIVMKLSPRSGGGVVVSLPLREEPGAVQRGRIYLPESGYSRPLVELSELLPTHLFLEQPG